MIKYSDPTEKKRLNRKAMEAKMTAKAKGTTKAAVKKERTFKPTEVATILGLSSLRIRRMCQEGRGKAGSPFEFITKDDGKWIITESMVRAEIARRQAKVVSFDDALKALEA